MYYALQHQKVQVLAEDGTPQFRENGKVLYRRVDVGEPIPEAATWEYAAFRVSTGHIEWRDDARTSVASPQPAQPGEQMPLRTNEVKPKAPKKQKRSKKKTSIRKKPQSDAPPTSGVQGAPSGDAGQGEEE